MKRPILPYLMVVWCIVAMLVACTKDPPTVEDPLVLDPCLQPLIEWAGDTVDVEMPVSLGSDLAPFDFDQDGTVDLTLKASHFGNGIGHAYGVSVLPGDSMRLIYNGYGCDFGPCQVPFEAGDLIIPSMINEETGTGYMACEYEDPMIQCNCFSTGGYVAFAKTKHSEPCVGYVRIRTSSSLPEGWARIDRVVMQQCSYEAIQITE